MDEPLIYRITAVMQLLGVSRATIYRLAARGELKLVRMGRKASGITTESIKAFVARGGVQLDR
jgi:excisionase family DNA binding protein